MIKPSGLKLMPAELIPILLVTRPTGSFGLQFYPKMLKLRITFFQPTEKSFPERDSLRPLLALHVQNKKWSPIFSLL